MDMQDGGIILEIITKEFWNQVEVMNLETNRRMVFLIPLRYDINFGDEIYYVSQLKREYPLLYWRKAPMDLIKIGMTTVITEIVLHGNGDVIDGRQLVTNLKGHKNGRTSDGTKNSK
jgi:hypothetical protein